MSMLIERAELDRFLRDGGWHRAAVITAATGLSAGAIRQIAGEFHHILGSCIGYKLASMATQAELRHAQASLRSRAQSITARAAALNALIA